MADKKIVVVIGNDGSYTVEGEHFSGPTCDKELRKLAESLGVIDAVTQKPEYFESAGRTVNVEQNAGG